MPQFRRVIAIGVLVCATVPTAVAQEAAPENARSWLGQAEQIEQFIREARVVDVEDIGAGVTNPKRVQLEPGGPVDRIAFKPIRPGNYRGHRESYLSEIAAYELDKLLELGITPPTVEKRIERDVGAAVMWVAPAQSFSDLGGPPSPPSTRLGRWNYQLICAKMFHNLIFNKDPNLGNLLVDPAWNLILIDNSRAFTTGTQMVHKLTRVDQDLWDRFLALDEPTLTTAVSEWLDDGQIRAILARRDRMAEDIEEMVAERGRASVFVRFREVSDAPRRADPDADTEVDLQVLADQLLSAVNETPVLLPGSELTWIGEVVPLTAYEGPDTDIARAGVERGLTFGIVTSIDGLLCLTRDARNPRTL